MHFFHSLLVGATAFASFALAQGKLQFTVVPAAVVGGRTYTVKYSGGDENAPARIVLRKGPSTASTVLTTITDSAEGGSFTWNVDNSLVTGNDYALEIIQGSDTNYQAVNVSADGTPTTSVASHTSTSASHSSHTTHTKTTTKALTTLTSGSTTVTRGTKTRTITSTQSSTSTSATDSSSATAAQATTTAPGAAANIKANAGLLIGAIAAAAYLA